MTVQDTSPKSSRTGRIERYDPASIEPRWQQRWEELGLHRTDLSDRTRPTFYLRTMGATFDWEAEVVTADPAYYRWNQWLFLRFLEADLAYRQTSAVDWCPNDGTLAREQVEGADRHCWRCGAKVEKRDLPQWYLRVTRYADELLDFSGIDFPDPIRVMQTNWIGRSSGAEIVFETAASPHHPGGEELRVFSTRPDTL